MPLHVTSFQSTPNPNAIKCIVDRPTGEQIRSYFRPEQAETDPLARALFAIPGVTNVMIQPDFISIGKSPDAAWRPIRAAIEQVLLDAR